MKISIGFYIRYWFKNSIMALGIGFIPGFLSSVIILIYNPYINAFLGSIIACLIYQVILYRHFWGSRRGDFEYEYRNELIEKDIRKIILKNLGFLTYIRYYLDQFNRISTAQKDICEDLLRNKTIINNDDYLFLIYIKAAYWALIEGNYEKEMSLLKSAVEIKPDNLIANYRLAVSCEINGNTENAIKHYKAAIKDPCLNTKQLIIFITSQIDRIQVTGPLKKPPMLGLKYLSF